jgi:hypothetical protein
MFGTKGLRKEGQRNLLGIELNDINSVKFMLLYLPMAPQTCGDAILVPFISSQLRKVKPGTDVIAPPGAHTVTP